jgi:hypothetical protein
MATAYSSNLALALPATGELSGTWGTTVNTQITNMLDEALGYQAFSATGGADTLTIPDGTTGVARSIYIQLNGTGGGSVAVPATKTKMYFVFNNTASAITFKVTGQTGVSIPAAAKMALVSNGTDIIVAQNYFAALTLGAALPVLSGGTGVTTSTGTGNNVLSASPTLTGTVAGASLSLSSLTSGRVTYAGTAGLLQDSANLLFNGTTLTANTIGAFILAGTVAGGGNQLNNVIIGTTTPLAGAFTTLSATGTLTLSKVSGAADQLVISDTSNGAGLTIGADTNLYRTAANKLATDDDLRFGNDKGIEFNGTANYIRGSSATGVISVVATTGLAVTGTLTASGILRINSVLSGQFNSENVTAGRTAANIRGVAGQLFLDNVGSGDTYLDGAHFYVRTYAGTQIADFSSTGLAVTGALSATGTTVSSQGLMVRGSNLVAQASQVSVDQLNTTTSRLISWGPDNATAGIITLGVLSANASVGTTSVATVSSTGLAVTGTLSVGSGASDVTSYFNSTNANGAHIRIQSSGVDKAFIGCAPGFLGSGTANDLGIRAVGSILFATNGSSVDMTLDSSGTLLVGKTTSALATAGIELQQGGFLAVTRAERPFVLNRLTTDGDLIELYRDSVTKATIGITSSNLTFGVGGTEKMRLTSVGDFIVGDTVTGSLGVTIYNAAANANVGRVDIGKTASGAATAMTFRYVATAVGSISYTDVATAYNTSSDSRLKDNIQDAPDAAGLIDAIQVRQFNWKAGGSHQRYGFIAQELVTVAPEAVYTPTDPEEMMAVDYSKLVPMLVKELQSLRARVAQLESNP